MMETLDPILAPPKIDIEEPRRNRPLTDTPDPRDKKSQSDMEPPILIDSNRLTPLPSLATDLKLMDDPKLTKSKTDIVLPKLDASPVTLSPEPNLANARTDRLLPIDA
jgi:hypothetical protein